MRYMSVFILYRNVIFFFIMILDRKKIIIELTKNVCPGKRQFLVILLNNLTELYIWLTRCYFHNDGKKCFQTGVEISIILVMILVTLDTLIMH